MTSRQTPWRKWFSKKWSTSKGQIVDSFKWARAAFHLSATASYILRRSRMYIDVIYPWQPLNNHNSGPFLIHISIIRWKLLFNLFTLTMSCQNSFLQWLVPLKELLLARNSFKPDHVLQLPQIISIKQKKYYPTVLRNEHISFNLLVSQ